VRKLLVLKKLDRGGFKTATLRLPTGCSPGVISARSTESRSVQPGRWQGIAPGKLKLETKPKSSKNCALNSKQNTDFFPYFLPGNFPRDKLGWTGTPDKLSGGLGSKGKMNGKKIAGSNKIKIRRA